MSTCSCKPIRQNFAPPSNTLCDINAHFSVQASELCWMSLCPDRESGQGGHGLSSQCASQHAPHGACEMWPKGSDVSQRFCQGKKLVHICMESEQLKMKSNPGKFWRKCSFSDF